MSPPAPAPAIRVELAGRSVTGPVRDRNEDRLGWAVAGDLRSVRATAGDESLPSAEAIGPAVVAAVADGLGGHAGGDLASGYAITTLLDRLVHPAAPEHLPVVLRESYEEVNARLLSGELGGEDEGRRRVGQTTLTALVLTPESARVAHVGDCRLYRLRDQALELLTTDHSQAMDLLRLRLIRPEQAAQHPGRHLLTRSLGGDVSVKVDLRSGPVRAGDAHLLCSDGLWSAVTAGEIIAALEGDLAAGVEGLVERSLARGGDDNASVIAVRVLGIVEVTDLPIETPRRPIWRRILGP